MSSRITLKPGTCPECGIIIRTGTQFDGETDAQPRDIVVCRQCGEMLVLDDDLQPVVAVTSDIAHTAPDTLAKVRMVQEMIKEKARQQ